MPLQHEPRAVVLDVNETLVDFGGLAAPMREVGLDADALPLLVARVLRDGFAMVCAGCYSDFGSILRHHLGLLASGGEPEEEGSRVEHVLGALSGLKLFDDVAPGLRRLRELGYRIVTLTNGSHRLIRTILEREGLGEDVDVCLDVEAVGTWKPAKSPYEYAAREVELPTTRIVMIAVHPWDLQGAHQAGMLTAWLDRDGGRFPEFMTAPNVRGASLREVADALGPASR